MMGTIHAGKSFDFPVFILFSGHPGISVNELSPLSLKRWNIRHIKFDFHRLKITDSLLEEVTSPRKREFVHQCSLGDICYMIFLSTYKKIMFAYFRLTTSSSLLLQNRWTFEVALWWRNFKACYVLPERNKTTVCILDNMINRHSKDFKLAIWEISRKHLCIFHIIIWMHMITGNTTLANENQI